MLRPSFIFQIAILNLQFLLPVAAFPQNAPPAETFPYRQPPVGYFADELDDPVSKLRQKLDKGELRLEFEAGTGYLRSLLAALDIPVSSQMLVFGKNSVNARIISPENPRALYFNDKAYVGFVPGAPFLEITGVDSRKGAVFYALSQKRGEPLSEEPAKLPPVTLAREESCLLCHASANSLNVPGHLVRSFVTDIQGNPVRGYSKINHDTPYANRWGGWYVTGDFDSLPHLGNLSTAADLLEHDRHRDGPGNRPGRTVNLAKRIDAAKYLAAHSDIVALLVHDHQTHMHNLLTRLYYEQQYETPDSSVEHLLRYMLFVDEPALENPVLGGSAYESWFAKQGPPDRRGRSLRQFDLEMRLFKYRCSYLIYSPAFDMLPTPAEKTVYRKLWEILTAADPPPPFDKLPLAERTAILEILRDTKPNLPGYWKR
ncbi:MAG TPA: hypothetical protein VGH74_03700 [Planctomycetaceae bacterium]